VIASLQQFLRSHEPLAGQPLVRGDAAHHWDTISTGTHRGREISPVAAELGDLVLRTGRLAYLKPRWTAACADTSPPRDPADLAATAGELRVVLAAVHHVTDAISSIAGCDTVAVRAAADAHRLYLPTRLLPENYDIPSPYAPLPPPMAGDLIGSYDTAAEVSLRAAINLDDVVVAIDAPSSTVAAARTAARPPAIVPEQDRHDNRQQQPHTSQSARVARPQAGQTERILRDLQITEPGMLLRAGAIDDAARDLLANANASSRHRDSFNHPEPRQIPHATCQAAKAAATDLPRAPADLSPSVRLKAPGADAPSGRTPQTALQKSRNHRPAIRKTQ
jgi:hypothetical protein